MTVHKFIHDLETFYEGHLDDELSFHGCDPEENGYSLILEDYQGWTNHAALSFTVIKKEDE